MNKIQIGQLIVKIRQEAKENGENISFAEIVARAKQELEALNTTS